MSSSQRDHAPEGRVGHTDTCRNNYLDKNGRVRVRYAFGVGLWESLCHVLHIDHMRVFAVPARIVVAAYAFVVLVFSNTYLANLAAFLTADRLNTQSRTLRDLWGKPVGTYGIFQDAIEQAYGLSTIDIPAVGNSTLHPTLILPTRR